MKKYLKYLIFAAIIGLAAYAGQDIIINTARLDGFIYGNKSGGIDTLIVPATDSIGQYKYKNVRDPQDLYDAVNYKTLLSGGGAGLDSIPFNPLSGDLEAYFGGVNFYTTNLDGRYIAFSDTITSVITPSQLSDSLAIRDAQIISSTYVYTISLPIAGTLAGSIAAAVSGTDYPSGWILTASGTNLQINHGLGRYCASVNVSYNSSGTIYRQLVSWQSAYSTIQNNDTNNVDIISISNYYSQYKLRINLIFE